MEYIWRIRGQSTTGAKKYAESVLVGETVIEEMSRQHPPKGTQLPLIRYSLLEMKSQSNQDSYLTLLVRLLWLLGTETHSAQLKKCTRTPGVTVQLDSCQGWRQVRYSTSFKGCRVLYVLVRQHHSYVCTSLLVTSQSLFTSPLQCQFKTKLGLLWLLFHLTTSSLQIPILLLITSVSCRMLRFKFWKQSVCIGPVSVNWCEIILICHTRRHRFPASLEFKQLWAKEQDSRERSLEFLGQSSLSGQSELLFQFTSWG